MAQALHTVGDAEATYDTNVKYLLADKQILALILDNVEEGFSEKRILEKLQKHFQLSPQAAEEYYKRFALQRQ